MSEQSLISVIVPVYNVERSLDRCVRSITEQTYRHLEIILVDDGSQMSARECAMNGLDRMIVFGWFTSPMVACPMLGMLV